MSTVDNHSVSHNIDTRAIKPWFALRDMQPSSYGVVCAVHGDAYFTTMLASRGLTAGAELTVLRNSGHGLLLIMVRDTCLALGRSEAAWIEVELIAAQEEPAEPAN
jgi:Fe2+ transport system protein FeoA